MKKIKIFTCLATLTALGTISIPLTSCSVVSNCTITFSCTEGIQPFSTQSVKVKAGTKWKDVVKPEVKVKDDSFDTHIGWWDINEHKELKDDMEITKDTSAKYIVFKSTEVIVNVTIKVDDKTFGPVKFVQGRTFAEFKEIYTEMKIEPKKDHCKFGGWFVGDTKLTDKYIFPNSKDITIEAHFNPICYNVTTQGSSDTIKFNDIPSTINIGNPLFATYTYDTTTMEIDKTNSDILVNSKSIKEEWAVVYLDGKIYIPSDLITGDITIKIVTKVKVGLITTDWPKIISACNTFEDSDRGQEAIATFLSNFTITGKETLTTLDDLVGTFKLVTINNQPHVVRIIGTQHDTISKDQTNAGTKAALTFELVTLLSNNNGDAIKSIWDKTNNYDYTNSVLRANLTGKGASTKTFSTTALLMLPEQLQTGIKKVSKSVATKKDSDTEYIVNTYDDELFPLTYTEMAQTDSTVQKEGETYKYWKAHDTSGYRTKKDVNTKTNGYWLTSPGTGYENNVWLVYRDGNIVCSYVNHTHGVTFGFCI